jgi:hypothetical protein
VFEAFGDSRIDRVLEDVMDWYFCLEHQAVEHGPGCPNAMRLGPYATEEEASAAIERAHERSEAFDEDE